jgi:hypothetical protein
MIQSLIATDDNNKYEVPTPRQLAIFTSTKKAVNGPNIAPFLLDLASPSIRTPWNKRAAYIFAEHFVQQPGVISLDAKVIRGVFLAHLRTLYKQYRDQNAGSDTENERATMVREENNRKAKEHRQRLVCLPPL